MSTYKPYIPRSVWYTPPPVEVARDFLAGDEDAGWVTLAADTGIPAPPPPQPAPETISTLDALASSLKNQAKAYSKGPFSTSKKAKTARTSREAFSDSYVSELLYGDDANMKKYKIEEDEPAEPPMDIEKKKISEVIKFAIYDPAYYPKVDDVYKKLVVERKDFTLPVISKAPDVLVGVELEVENVLWAPASSSVNSSLFTTVWNTVEDASLRNNGREFVSQVGVRAKDIPKALEIFRSFMALATDGKSQATYRCGTHVHIDVRDLTIGQYINMLSLYILFEDYFYAISGDRKDNIFCVPINGSECGVSGLYALLRKDKPTPRDFKKLFIRFSKYMAYNLRPTGFTGNPGRPTVPIGTVEFRHHEGCSDTVRLSNWVQAIVDVYYTAQQFTSHELLDQIFNLNSISTYREFATSVFTNPIPLSAAKLEECMYQGSRHIKELYLEEEDA